MNPNVALATARIAVDQFRAADNVQDAMRAADSLVEAFEALDEWMSSGGFPPKAWTSNKYGRALQ